MNIQSRNERPWNLQETTQSRHNNIRATSSRAKPTSVTFRERYSAAFIFDFQQILRIAVTLPRSNFYLIPLNLFRSFWIRLWIRASMQNELKTNHRFKNLVKIVVRGRGSLSFQTRTQINAFPWKQKSLVALKLGSP